MRKAVSGLILALLLTSMLTLAFNFKSVKAWTGTVYIRADGSIDPPDAPIITFDNITYTLTDNITSSANGIVVEIDNIILDGASYTLHGIGSGYGISLSGKSNVTIKNTNIKGFGTGVRLDYSSNNTFSGNNVTANNYYGVWLSGYSNYNSIVENNVTANDLYGIYLSQSSYNSISKNVFVNDGLAVSNSYGNVVDNNLVNDKPLIYLEDASDYVLEDGGQVVLVNCNHIKVKNLNLSNTAIGIQLWKTNNTEIYGNTIANNQYGLVLYESFYNSISINNITNNEYGVRLYSSSSSNIVSRNNIIANNDYGVWLWDYSNNNTISRNNITNNEYGIVLDRSCSFNIVSGNNITANTGDGVVLSQSSNYNSISANTITANSGDGIGLRWWCTNNSICANNITRNSGDGIELHWQSNNNVVYHNSFIGNTIQAYIINSLGNNWDGGYPSGGNYWSDYTGVDADNDGIGDEPYTIDANNSDRYPLAGPINVFDAGTWNETDYNVDVVSNSTVSSFTFNPDEGPFLRFNVTGEDGTTGFCRVTIPKGLLWVENGWTITVDDQQITDYTLIPNENYTYLYFTYNHSTKTVTIQGTNVILEFPATTILLALILTTLIATVLFKKKRKTNPKLP